MTAEFLTQSPVQAAPAPRQPGRWVEVVSHLDPSYGGLSAAVPELARSLARGVGGPPVEVSLAAFCAPGEHFKPAGFAAEQLTYWPAARKPWLADSFRGHVLHERFCELLRGAAGVHIHGLWEQSTAVAAKASRSLRLPYVVSAHGMLEPWALANRRVKKLLYAALVERNNVASARCLHALTQAEAQHYLSFGGRSPVAVIPNAVEVPARKDGAAFRQKFADLQGKRIVLFMARLHPKKGLDLLLEAWARVAGGFPDARLVIAGPDSEGTLARLQKLTVQRRLERSVLFPGMLRGEMKWSALAAAEAFVLPSFSEGLSVGVLEAMGMGLPVIVTGPCNMPEVREYEAGWEIEPRLDELTLALRDLLQRGPLENMETGTRGAELVKARYTWPVVSRQMAELYAWAAGGEMPSSVDLVFPAGAR